MARTGGTWLHRPPIRLSNAQTSLVLLSLIHRLNLHSFFTGPLGVFMLESGR
ncbi:MAG: hypothetical protein J6T88_10955 [Bacteroidales bacterium]|nr:hypothetical protein [Bacteroidales bacterium]